jgi:NADH-quinone oxidoreductase subunit L
VIGMGVALKLYGNLPMMQELKNKWSKPSKLLENKWYIDEIYENSIVTPIQRGSNFLWKSVDVAVIDKIVLGFGRVSLWTGQTMRTVQTGSLQVYAVMILVGLILSLGYLLYGVL